MLVLCLLPWKIWKGNEHTYRSSGPWRGPGSSAGDWAVAPQAGVRAV